MIKLILTSFGLGAGLAMDACAVSMTNGLNEPKMKASKALLIAATFAVFQALMPLIGWLCVSLVADRFAEFAKWVPYIALVLLIIIGGKMLYDGISGVMKEKKQTQQEDAAVNVAAKPLTIVTLLAQAVATSIDALSTGFTLSDIAGNNFLHALLCVGIIAAVTFGICVGAVYLGKKFGDKLGGKAEILGGVILMLIGVEIFVTGVFM